MFQEYRTCVIQSITQELPDIRAYILEPIGGTMPFQAGQFITVAHPYQPDLQAPLSLISSPFQQYSFEIMVRRAGRFGAAFYDQAKIGDTLNFLPPRGSLVTDPRDTRGLCFIARDHAIAAARSILRFLAEAKSSRPFLLAQEITRPSEILVAREFFARPLPTFRRYLTLDSPQPEPEWHGPTGRLTAATLSLLLPWPDRHHYFLAGEGNDIRHYKSLLEQIKVPERQIRIERWS